MTRFHQIIVIGALISIAGAFWLGDAAPVLNMAGFSWAENLIFDGKGNLFVSDAVTGTFWRIYFDSTQGSYVRTIHVGNFTRTLGLAIDPTGTTLYGIAISDDKKSLLIKMDPQRAGVWSPLASTPKPGNGLALHFKTGLLYTASEGYFIPGNGEVFEIDPTSGKVTSIMSGLYSADGAWIDQDRSLLYVSEVVLGKVIIYDLIQRKQIKKYNAPLKMLDDFCLSQDGNIMFGADFWNGTIVAFAANGTSTSGTILASGLKSPTSVRLGSGANFGLGNLYVTEGGGLFKWTKDRRVLELVQSNN